MVLCIKPGATKGENAKSHSETASGCTAIHTQLRNIEIQTVHNVGNTVFGNTAVGDRADGNTAVGNTDTSALAGANKNVLDDV